MQSLLEEQAQHTEPSGGAAARVAAAGPRLAAPRLAFVWQAQYTRWGAAGWPRLAGRGWLSCGRRSTQSLNGPRLAGPRLPFVWHPPLGRGWLRRGWLSCGRRSTHVQSLLEEQAQHTEASGGAAARVAAAGPRLAAPRLAFVWQAQYTEPSGGAAARVAAAGARLAGRGWLSCGRRSTQSLLEDGAARAGRCWPRLPFVWQAQYTDPSGGAGVHVLPLGRGRVAGAVHRAFWRSCCTRGRRWLLCGRRSTQSLPEELLRALLRAWPPLGRGWLAAAGFRVAGAVHRALMGRGWLGRGWLSSCGRRSTQSLLEELLRAWLPLGRGWLLCGKAKYT